ncbi:MAG: extracellular solute-binding protein [Microbacteriaceae bacterium]|nr:extracellular solute-binding protein [Microbacteriaceae bacterium]
MEDDASGMAEGAAALQGMIDSFESETGTSVVYESVPFDQLFQKVSLAVQSGGDIPDVVETASQEVFSRPDVFMDITSLLADAPFQSQVGESEKTTCVHDGVRRCVAVNIGSTAWFYSPSLLGDVAWPQTDEEWLTAGAELKAKGLYIASFYAGRDAAGVEQTWAPAIISAGGEIFDANGKPAWANDATVDVVTWMRELLARGYVPETNFTGDFAAGEQPFIDGDAVGLRGGSWSAQFVPPLAEGLPTGDAVVGAAPSIDGGPGYVTLYGQGWAVPEGAANPEDAAAFLAHLMTPSNQATWATAAYRIPTNAEAFADPGFAEVFASNQAFYTAIQNLTDDYGLVLPTSPCYTEALTRLGETLQTLMLDSNADAMDALLAAQNEVAGSCG